MDLDKKKCLARYIEPILMNDSYKQAYTHTHTNARIHTLSFSLFIYI